ncbi:MAG TPA: hypothetical protein VGG28_09410 [Kofleriaceae bacterium]
MKWSLLVLAACGSPKLASDAAQTPSDAAQTPAITATVNSTRFVVREHMLAAGEMQISGEPLAQAMGRDLGNYSRAHLPTDLYFDTSPWSAGPWIDLPGFSTAVESYEYSKQPMNFLGFESAAGTSLEFGPLIAPHADQTLQQLILHFATGSNALGRFVFATQPMGWPGIWPTLHLFASFDPASQPTGNVSGTCSISSDDDPGSTGALTCADYECDATSLHLTNRAAQADFTITPGADGFATWKYGLWSINYLQSMHDANETAVTSVDPAQLASVGSAGNSVVADGGVAGTYLGSSDIEGFQAQLFLLMADNRAADWLANLTTTDGVTLSGFASTLDALSYAYDSPLRYFANASVTEAIGSAMFPQPSYAIATGTPSVLDLAGLALGYATVYALTDASNKDVGGSQPALAYFDGDPFAADDGSADGENTLHDRALAIIRVAVIDLDRMAMDSTGVLVDSGRTIDTTSVAYTLLALRAVRRALSSQLELYSNNTPDSAVGTTPLDALATHYPDGSTFSQRVDALIAAEANLMFTQLTDATGRAYAGWNAAAGAPTDLSDQTGTLDAHTAAIRGLFAAYLATGDARYHDRAIAVYARLDATFYDAQAHIYGAAQVPVDEVEFTPLRFALLQSTLRDMYELVATRPGGESLEPVLEDRIARLDKLVLNGWDDRDGDRQVNWPSECVNVDGSGLPRGGLQMAERALTGELGIYQEQLPPGKPPTYTSDRESDCVPEIDDAQLPAALADSVTFHVQRSM